MAMTESAKRRRKIVRRLQREGEDAYHEGRTIQACPREYAPMDQYQWRRGYSAAVRDDKRRNT